MMNITKINVFVDIIDEINFINKKFVIVMWIEKF